MLDETAFTDATAAHAWMSDYLRTVAIERQWTEMELQALLQDVDDSLVASDEGLALADLWGAGEDVALFWDELRTRAEGWTVDGADKLRTLLGMPAVVIADIEAEQEAASPSTIVGGTVTGAAEDIGEAAEDAADTVRSPWFWPIVGAVAVLGVVLASRVR